MSWAGLRGPGASGEAMNNTVQVFAAGTGRVTQMSTALRRRGQPAGECNCLAALVSRVAFWGDLLDRT